MNETECILLRASRLLGWIKREVVMEQAKTDEITAVLDAAFGLLPKSVFVLPDGQERRQIVVRAMDGKTSKVHVDSVVETLTI